MATAAHPRTTDAPPGRDRRLLPVAVAVAVALLPVGCTGSASTSSSSGGSSLAAPAAARVGAGAPGSARAATGAVAGAKVTGRDVATQTRSRVLTASLTLQVPDVAKASAAAARAATAAGGYVGTEGLEAAGGPPGPGADGRPTATATLRIPPARLDAVLATLASLGRVTAQQRSDTDVTGQVADLDARLVTQRASLVRLRGLFAGARDLPQVTALEQALTTREADLESLTAQRKAVAGQVDDATVTVTLSAPAPPAVVRASTPLGFGRGLAGGWSALVGTVRVAAATLGAVVPFLPGAAVVVALVLWRRRVRSRRAGLTAGPTAGPPTAGPPTAPSV